MKTTQLDTFTRAYIACALWSTTEDCGGHEQALDEKFTAEDISPETMERIIADCQKFQTEQNEHFWKCNHDGAGHDFWLTRNGHGAGFWDGDWSEPAATVLTKASKAFGECHLYVGDDGKLYIA